MKKLLTIIIVITAVFIVTEVKAATPFNTKSIIRLKVPQTGAMGSAVIIGENIALTAAHVVNAKGTNNAYQNIQYCLNSFNCEYKFAEIIYTDPKTDIAVVYVEGIGGTPVEVANSNLLDIGDELFFAGFPAKANVTFNVSKGIVSGMQVSQTSDIYYEWVHTDSQLSPGYSGGGVFDKKGRLVGIINAEDSYEKEIGYIRPTVAIIRSFFVTNPEDELFREAFANLITNVVSKSLLKVVETTNWLYLRFINDNSDTLANELAPELTLFEDVPLTHFYYTNIKYTRDNGVASGYKDNTFKPDQPITRAEFLKMAINKDVLEQKIDGSVPLFSDVSLSDWFVKYTIYARRFNIIDGYSDNTFKPNNNITQAESLKIILEMYSIIIRSIENHLSKDWGSLWHNKYMMAAFHYDLLPREIQSPNKELTRAEMAFMIEKIHKMSKTRK